MEDLQMEIIEAQRKLFRLQSKYSKRMTLSGADNQARATNTLPMAFPPAAVGDP